MKKIILTVVCCLQVPATIFAMESPERPAQSLHVVVDLGVVVATKIAPLVPSIRMLSKLTVASTQEQPQGKELLEQLKQQGYTLSLIAEKKTRRIKKNTTTARYTFCTF